LGDACSLVDAYRAGELSPLEALEATIAAIDASDLNAFAHLDLDAARDAAAKADVSLPFGGVPVGIKELERVVGWPFTSASLALQDRVAEFDATMTIRLRQAGAVLVGATTASEFGGINLTRTRLHGATRNPWQPERTPGGSSGGSAAAVAGGLLPLASAGDGGGSIRIPAGFTGLFGLKATFGRIPRGPDTSVLPLTGTIGCVSRSVRDTARWFDACNGFDSRDPYSLPRVEGWEAGLGSSTLAGLRAAVLPDLGRAVLHPGVEQVVRDAADRLVEAAGLRRVDVDLTLPEGGRAWGLLGMISLRHELGDRWPERSDQLTREIQLGLENAERTLNLDRAAAAEGYRRQVNETMADLFDQVDVVLTSTNPDVAFAAEGPMPTTVGERDLRAEMGLGRALGNHGALTIPANIAGNPAVSVPAGEVDGLPVGLQILGRHHEETVLLDLARVLERDRPWPLVAPSAPC